MEELEYQHICNEIPFTEEEKHLNCSCWSDNDIDNFFKWIERERRRTIDINESLIYFLENYEQ